MNLSNIIVQGGLLSRGADQYTDEQGAQNYAAKARELGVKKMDAEGSLLSQKTDLERLRGDIEKNELTFKQATAPQRQAIETGDLQQQQRMQPIKQGIEQNTGDAALAAAKTSKDLAPGASTIAKASQQTEIQGLKEKQAANIWGMVKLGDQQGALDALSSSDLLFPGRKFDGIVRGQVPAKGNDGQPIMGADGKPTMENVIMLKPADNSAPVYIPEKALDALVTKHNTSLQKVDKNLVRVGADGKVTPLYEPDNFKSTSEGDIYSGRTGLPPAAAGVSGQPGAGGAPKVSRQTTRLDERVKMAVDKVILPKYGGKFEGGMFFPDEANKDVALRATQLAGELVRKGTDPEAAGAQAIAQAEREKAMKAGGANAAYDGPTPWKK